MTTLFSTRMAVETLHLQFASMQTMGERNRLRRFVSPLLPWQRVGVELRYQDHQAERERHQKRQSKESVAQIAHQPRRVRTLHTHSLAPHPARSARPNWQQANSVPPCQLRLAPQIWQRCNQRMHQSRKWEEPNNQPAVHDMELYNDRHSDQIADVRTKRENGAQIGSRGGRVPRGSPGIEDRHVDSRSGLQD